MRLICIDGDEEVVRDAGLDVEKNVNAASRLVPPSKPTASATYQGMNPTRHTSPIRTLLKLNLGFCESLKNCPEMVTSIETGPLIFIM